MLSCRKLKQSWVKITQIDDQEQNVRKYLYVKIQNKKVKVQLDLGSDIFIINTQTWKNIGKQTLFYAQLNGFKYGYITVTFYH